MKIVISCCDSKNGSLFQHNGAVINFVSQVTGLAQVNGLNVRPDDSIPNESITWRELIAQQQIRGDLQLAYRLYKPSIYSSMYQHYKNDFFIFSAGWGIVRADFRLPKYNVTFSHNQNVPAYARRRRDDVFNDFNQLEGTEGDERIVLIAGKDYVLPFCQLTEDLPNEKIIIYKSKRLLNNNPYLGKHNFHFIHYQTSRSMNWHYEFAKRLINNEIEI